MIRLLKALWNFLTHKANTAAKALDSLVTAQDKLNKVKAELLKKLDKQKKDAVELFAYQEKFEETYKDLKKKCDDLKSTAKKLKEENASKDKLQLAAQEYLTQKSVLDEMTSQKKVLDNNVKTVEDNLKRFSFNKNLIEIKSSALETKISLYKNLKNISVINITDINSTFNEVEKVVNDIKYDINAEEKVKEMTKEEETSAFDSADVDDFIKSL